MTPVRARARVWCVIRAARRIQDSSDVLGQEARARLPSVTSLSSESIELALREHLETRPTEAELDALLASTTEAPVCHVVLSANVFTAPLRALALAVATSERVYVRPSRRDPVVTELLVKALADDPEFALHGGHVEIVESIRPEPLHELHLYGSDESIASITAGLPPGVVVRAHGTGIGIAVIGASVDIGSAANALARDVVVFDQRGCLSPRFAFVEGDAVRAEVFALALHEALGRLAERYPRGVMDSGLQAEMAQYRATMQAIGSYWSHSSHAVGLDPAPRALVLPPAARFVHVVPANVQNIEALLSPWIRYVTAAGMDDEGELASAILKLVPNARVSRLGCMQRPLLDGPVDRRTSLHVAR
ncbi:MAG: proline dehydrogenase [Polyangiaceae bacterium]|nr:proline dehydrogenase [Polyangiaceae bacterium]